MTGRHLQIRIAEMVKDRGFCCSHHIHSQIERTNCREIDPAIENMLGLGVLARSQSAARRLCLMRPVGPVNLGPPVIEMHLRALEAAEQSRGGTGRGSSEYNLGFRFGRESADECVDVGWLLLRPGERVRSGLIEITPRGRAVLFRHRGDQKHQERNTA